MPDIAHKTDKIAGFDAACTLLSPGCDASRARAFATWETFRMQVVVAHEKRRLRKLSHCLRLSRYPSACAKSAMMSSISSMPTETRSMDSVTPISDFIGWGTSRCEAIQG